MFGEKIERVSIICSKGSLEGVYPALIMANGARAEGIAASLFFTFFGLDAIVKKRMDHVKVSAVGNPGLHMPTLLGALPGASALVTLMMERKMAKLDIPPVPEFIAMVADAGCKIYACKASVDLFGLKKEDFCEQVSEVLSVGDFYGISAGAQIIFT